MNALPIASHRAMQAEPVHALAGNESLDELSFQQLLDLQDEASHDDSFDTFNDVARELKHRRDDGKDALERLFIEQAKEGGEVPMVSGGKIANWTMRAYLMESMGDAWASMMADALLRWISRNDLFAAMAREYVEQQSEDLLRAGWTE